MIDELKAIIDDREWSKSMSEYIKRENVLQAIAGLLNVTEQIDSADVVEVRHGHWVFCGVVDDIYGHGASCSVCGEYSEDNGYYCSCCGAKMDDALQRKTNPEAF